MQSFDVYKHVNALCRTRGDDLSNAPGTTVQLNETFPGDKNRIHVVAGLGECLQILKDPNFIQPKIADAIAAVFSSIGSEGKVIENFLRKNPIGLDGQSHIAARQSFLSNFRSTQRNLSPGLPSIAEKAFESFIARKKPSITADLIEPYVDSVVEVILRDKTQSVEIRRESWSGYASCVFEYFHSPAKLKRKDAQVSGLLDQLGSGLAAAGQDESNVGAVLLSYVLQGRDPLIGGLSAYMHSLTSLAEDQRSPSIARVSARELFWRSSPVNYIGRIATKPASVGSIQIEAGDHLVLMLPWANHDRSATPETSLAFGAGPHICAGQGLALAIGGAWIDALKSHHMRIRWEEIRPDASTPAVFRQYSTP